MSKVAVVVLAAGQGKRMGTGAIKQLVRIEGEALINRAVRVAQKSRVGDVFVVIGYMFEQLEAVLSDTFPAGEDLTIVRNAQWEEGIASSIRAAIKTVAEFDAVLFTTVDQPFVGEHHLKLIVDKFITSNTAIVASRYGDPPSPGIPAIFGKSMFSTLLTLHGDRGAKRIIAEYDSLSVDISEASFDVDTRSDLQTCLKIIDEKVPVGQ